jgi:predicted DsbA family dithiol-disulfide isomerase
MAAPQTQEKVERETLVGRAIGMTGTPAFLINRKRLIGAQPPAVFDHIFEGALKERAAERTRP